MLCKESKESKHSTDDNGKSPLQIAADIGHLSYARMVVTWYLMIRHSVGVTPLNSAAENITYLDMQITTNHKSLAGYLGLIPIIFLHQCFVIILGACFGANFKIFFG